MIVHKLQKPISCEIDLKAYDKSISHRAAIFSLLSDKPSKIENYLCSQDCLNSLKIIKQLGARVSRRGSLVKIIPINLLKGTHVFEGKERLTIKAISLFDKIISPNDILQCGNSGTTIRLLMGYLAAKDGLFVLSGDKYLNARPMQRIAKPLNEFGADISLRDEKFAPVVIKGKKLDFIDYKSPISSAQVKSAVLLAGISSNGAKFSEVSLSRDHSENMLKFMGADIKIDGLKIEIKPALKPLKPLNIKVPNDPSSCFFFAVAAAIVPNSKILLKDVLLNKTRVEAFKILKKMGVKVEFNLKENSYEEIGDIYIEQAELKAVEVSQNISWLIDEIPALGVAFAFAKGKSRVKNAKELRVKESDRISSTVQALKACGIEVVEFEDGFEVTGGKANSACIDSKGDHRIAMSFMIMGLMSQVEVKDIACIKTSFPNFIENLKLIGAKIEN